MEEGTFTATYWAPDVDGAIHKCRKEMACSQSELSEEENYEAYLERQADAYAEVWHCVDSYRAIDHIAFLREALEAGPGS